MSAVRTTPVRLLVWRWIRDLLTDLAMGAAWQVERIERAERDRQHAEEWRASLARALTEDAS